MRRLPRKIRTARRAAAAARRWSSSAFFGAWRRRSSPSSHRALHIAFGCRDPFEKRRESWLFRYYFAEGRHVPPSRPVRTALILEEELTLLAEEQVEPRQVDLVLIRLHLCEISVVSDRQSGSVSGRTSRRCRQRRIGDSGGRQKRCDRSRDSTPRRA